MKRLMFCFVLSLFLMRVEPVVYELVRSDGQVVARTEAVPSVGDAYWDAISDEWYTVLSVKGSQATVGTQAETKRFFMVRNLRLATGALVFISGTAWYARRRRLRARRRG